MLTKVVVDEPAAAHCVHRNVARVRICRSHHFEHQQADCTSTVSEEDCKWVGPQRPQQHASQVHSPQATGLQIALRLLFKMSADTSNVSRLKQWRTGMEEAVGQQLLQITLDSQLGQPLAINALRAAPATNALSRWHRHLPYAGASSSQ